MFDYSFDAAAGDGVWRAAVRNFLATQIAYSEAKSGPETRQPSPPRPSGQVIDLQAWRAVRAAEADPVEEAGEAYQTAALRLLSTWAPNSTELREQMRLAAEFMGLPDPRLWGGWRQDRRDLQPTPETISGLIFAATYGLVQAERAPRAAEQ